MVIDSELICLVKLDG